jgi:hypothetical protein
MPGSLQNKLQQFEVTPPPSTWEKISERLDQEFVPGDAIISSNLENASVLPPAGIWNNISQNLHEEFAPAEPVTAPARVVPLFYKRIAAAAVIIGLLAIGSFYFFSGNKIKQQEVVKNTPANTPATREVKPLAIEVDPPSPVVTKAPGIASFTAKRKITSGRSQPEYAPLYELNTVSALQPVSISAPPLRDKKGNIILDIAMISNPDDEYIIVTGPNGKQTKISSKFLSCLGYINANINSNETDLKGIRCKAQFEEWRRRLLSEPAFIPTANNFFDIFELKDLLQEM